MHEVLKNFTNLPEFETLRHSILEKQTCAVFGVDAQKAYLASALRDTCHRKAFLVVPDEGAARQVTEALEAVGEHPLLFPAREYALRNIESVSRFRENTRIETISRIRKKDFTSIVITAEALCSFVMHPDDYREYLLTRGDEYPLEKLGPMLTELGYTFTATVEGPGQYSIRGGIADIFPPGEELPYRLEFYGDEIDTVYLFDIQTQRRTEPKDQIKITPTKEQSADLTERLRAALTPHKKNRYVERDLDLLDKGMLPSHDRYLPLSFPKKANILDYLDEETCLFLFDFQAIKDAVDGFCFRFEQDTEALLEDGYFFLSEPYFFSADEIMERIGNPIFMQALPSGLPGIRIEQLVNLTVYPTNFTTQPALIEEVTELLADGWTVHLLALTKEHLTELNDIFRGYAKLHLSVGTLPVGFSLPQIKTAVYTFKKRILKKQRQMKFARGERIKSFSDIHDGDYVVHENYGVGQYAGIHKIETQGVTKDYIKIQFAGTDVLYIPCDQLQTISKYIGAHEDSKVKLNKLGGSDWQKTKQRVKKAVRDLAKQLTALYGERAKAVGYPFSQDTEWQKDFEASFAYDETDDQLRCIREIKQDMESNRPMDRLLCGDVGFGKTEVALRAIFKCVMDSKQAVLLAPTTILAYQHYMTVLERFKGYPVKIELLSRFRTPQQQEEILSRTKKGLVDLVIGTHRLLQKDVKFKDLGLIVIDEEQRFGVAHKEHLKELAIGADVLTLSATPIPRTLNMAMNGLRDISTIYEAPRNRFPVTTYVAEHDMGLICDAIRREVARGGQCFYLHNRIDTIFRVAATLEEKTGVRIRVAHGKMSQEELSSVWSALVDGEIDVLVCTTIIETGVDVPNCNTLIIEDADKLGLAQLYQIRGRVGRSDRRAYAYFTFRRGKTLSQDAYKRLMSIKEFTEFGSGLKIAMRDLEIRGAGDVLGAEQSGHIVTVGFDMYMKLLEEAVREEQGTVAEQTDCTVELKVNAYIPDDFIRDTETRIEVYKMIAGIENDEDASDVLDEIIDRFGDPPKQLCALLKIADIRRLANLCGIPEIEDQGDGKVLIYTPPMELAQIAALSAQYRRKLLYSAGQKPYFTLKTENLLSDLEQFLRNMVQGIDKSENS